jgi:molybdopterin-guanine dinucleotide biosynthesis protein A
MSGLLTALEQSRTKYAFVLATDLWNVTSDGLKSILREISMDRDDCLVDVVYASAPDGRGQPLCSVWRVESSLEVVRQRFDSGEFSLFGVLERLHSVTVILEDPQLSNVNEPQDLENFLRSVVDER